MIIWPSSHSSIYHSRVAENRYFIEHAAMVIRTWMKKKGGHGQLYEGSQDHCYRLWTMNVNRGSMDEPFLITTTLFRGILATHPSMTRPTTPSRRECPARTDRVMDPTYVSTWKRNNRGQVDVLLLYPSRGMALRTTRGFSPQTRKG